MLIGKNMLNNTWVVSLRQSASLKWATMLHPTQIIVKTCDALVNLAQSYHTAFSNGN